MEDVTRKRVLRLLEGLPEAQLYQVLDYIEFLEAKYAREAMRKPDGFQRFAERVEDQLRVRSVAPRAMKGAMRVMSTAGRVLDGVRDLGRGVEGSGAGGGSETAGAGPIRGPVRERPEEGPAEAPDEGPGRPEGEGVGGSG